MYDSRISAGATEKHTLVGKPHAETVASSYDVEGHNQKCVERYCELANKNVEQFYRVSSPCLLDHHFKKEELEISWRIVKRMLTNCLEMLLFGTNWQTVVGKTNWHDQSPNGQELVTKVRLV